MKKLDLNTLSFCTIIFFSMNFKMLSQTIEQDPKIDVLLKEKRKLNSNSTINDKFKIQIFNGDSEQAKKHLVEFKKLFKETETTIVYNNPTYKVWVGSFETRIEAEKLLIDVKKKYPNALLIKPTK